MSTFNINSIDYDDVRSWIHKARQKGSSWQEIIYGCEGNTDGLNEMIQMQVRFNGWPKNMSPELWFEIVESLKKEEETRKYNRGSNYQYWYRFEPKSDGSENGYENTYSSFFLADDAKVTIIPSELIMQNFSNLGSTPSSDGTPKYYHIFIRSVGDGKFSLILREPASDVDVTKYTYKLE